MSDKPFMTIDEARDVLEVVSRLESQRGYANACREIIRLNEELERSGWKSFMDREKFYQNEIIRLNKELEKYRWIPVEEMLPENPNEIVDVITKDGFNDRRRAKDIGEAVAYWMHKIEPPEEVE